MQSMHCIHRQGRCRGLANSKYKKEERETVSERPKRGRTEEDKVNKQKTLTWPAHKILDNKELNRISPSPFKEMNIWLHCLPYFVCICSICNRKRRKKPFFLFVAINQNHNRVCTFVSECCDRQVTSRPVRHQKIKRKKIGKKPDVRKQKNK